MRGARVLSARCPCPCPARASPLRRSRDPPGAAAREVGGGSRQACAPAALGFPGRRSGAAPPPRAALRCAGCRARGGTGLQPFPSASSSRLSAAPRRPRGDGRAGGEAGPWEGGQVPLQTGATCRERRLRLPAGPALRAAGDRAGRPPGSPPSEPRRAVTSPPPGKRRDLPIAFATSGGSRGWGLGVEPPQRLRARCKAPLSEPGAPQTGHGPRAPAQPHSLRTGRAEGRRCINHSPSREPGGQDSVGRGPSRELCRSLCLPPQPSWEFAGLGIDCPFESITCSFQVILSQVMVADKGQATAGARGVFADHLQHPRTMSPLPHKGLA